MRPSVPADGQPVVLAQGFLERLFGGARRKILPPGGFGQQAPKQKKRRKQAAPAQPAVVVQPKDENAKRVYIFGDALAAGLENGLQEAFSETPTVEIVNAANPGSGLVRTDYYDWEKAIGDILAEQKVDIAVIMLGSNDRQQMRLESGRVSIRSESWQQTYIQRVDAILAQFAGKNIPVYWVGMPIMRSANYGTDMAYLNEIFQARASRAGARYVDTWNGFADQDGKYSSSGPDVNGKIRRLRAENGIHLTKHGNLKLAFFVEKEIRAQLEQGGALANIPLIGNTPLISNISAGSVEMDVSLTNPAAPPIGIGLLGTDGVESASPQAAGNKDGPLDKVLVQGEPVPAQSGRADDFSWPRNSRASEQGTAETPAI